MWRCHRSILQPEANASARDGLSWFFNVLDEIAQKQSHEFEQRNGDALPPLIGLNLFDQHRLMGDRGNAGLRLQRRSDLRQLLLQRVEALRALVWALLTVLLGNLFIAVWGDERIATPPLAAAVYRVVLYDSDPRIA